MGQGGTSFPEFKATDMILQSWWMRSGHSGPLALSFMGVYLAENQPLLVYWVEQWPPEDMSTCNL